MNLDKIQAITLSREVDDATYSSHPDKICFIGSVALSNKLDNLDDLNIFYVRQQIPLINCDILVSVVSAPPTETIEIPMMVNKLLKHIDCKLTIQYKKH